jgi:hypothetical protein
MQLLDQVDGVVFVVDSQRERFDENLASLEELRAALAAYGRSLRDLPLVVQYNKRDLADPYVLEELHRKLDMRGVAAFESVGTQGTAVLQALTTVSKAVIRYLRDEGDALAPAAIDVEPPAPPGPALELDPEEGDPPGPGAAPTLVTDLEVDEPKPAARGEGSLRLASAGPAQILDAGRLRLPVVLVDSDSRRRVSLVLTLELHAADEEDELA